MTDWAYWSFSWGGLMDGRSTDKQAHIVRATKHGTPGPTLCGIDRFAKHGPGGGYHESATQPPLSDSPHVVCGSCVDVARTSLRAALARAERAERERDEARRVGGLAASLVSMEHSNASPRATLTERERVLREVLDSVARNAHGYGLVRDHWARAATGPMPFEECTDIECVDARAALAPSDSGEGEK